MDELRKLNLNRQVVSSMIISAVERYPREVMGALTYSKKYGGVHVGGAIPYLHTVTKGYHEINHSKRTLKLRKWMNGVADVMDGWHSHPSFNGHHLEAGISEEDLDDIKDGDFEIIIALKPLKRKSHVPWRQEKKGIAASLNGYKFEIRAWQKTGKREANELSICIE